jgi:hypothetical protein
LPWLLLALASNLVPLFIAWVVFVFSFLGKFLLLLCFCFSSGRYPQFARRFRLDPDGPDEAQQLASHGGDDLSLIFSCRRKSNVALVQSVLRFPGNLLDLFWNPLLSLAQRRTDARPKPVAPGRFNRNSSEMRVAGFGDATAPGSPATGVLTGPGAAVT